MRKKTVILVSFFISCLFLVGMGKNAEAAKTLMNNSKDITFIDDNGAFVRGRPLNLKNVVPITYLGTDLKKDVYLYDEKGNLKNNGYGGLWAGVTLNNLEGSEVGRVRNTSYYKGKPTVLAFKDTRPKTQGGIQLTPNKNGGLVLTTRRNPSMPSFEIWIEDENQNKIIDDSVVFMTSQSAILSGPGPGNLYSTVEWNNPDAGLINFITNVGAQNTLTNLSADFLNGSDKNGVFNGVKLINEFANATSYDKQFTVDYNTVFQQTNTPLRISGATYYQQAYPDGDPIAQGVLAKQLLTFFDSSMPYLIAFPNPQVEVIETENTNDYSGKISLSQSVYAQSQTSFYKDLKINVQVPDGVSAANNVKNLVVKDHLGNIITNQTVITAAPDGKSITIMLKKELLQTMGNDVITVTGNLDLSSSATTMVKYDPTQSGVFTIPITANNSDNSDSSVSGNMKVKVPAPTGAAINDKKVTKDSQTADYKPNDFVENLNSLFTDDVIKAKRFDPPKKFTTVGNDTVSVVVQSEVTGMTSTIDVPVTVVEAPQDQVELAFDDQGKITEKVVHVDKSNIKNIDDTIYWKTNLPNQKYKLAVRGPDGDIQFTYAESITNGTEVNSFIKKAITVPTVLWNLEYGDNVFSFEIYRMNDKDEMIGDPVASVDYIINLSGSLQIKSVPTSLSWTGRLVNDSKGLLTRDSGQSMTLSVIDTRQKKDNWSLNAQIENESGEVVPFTFQWKETLSSDAKSLETAQTVLTPDSATDIVLDTYTKKWDEQTGVLLYSPSYLPVNNYSNKVSILWQLSSTKQVD